MHVIRTRRRARALETWRQFYRILFELKPPCIVAMQKVKPFAGGSSLIMDSSKGSGTDWAGIFFSAIRRRCKQKNWRKIISLRQQKCADTVKDQSDLSECKSEEKRQETVDVVATATRQLQELEQKLKDLTDQKHAKFQLLKEILVEEARSKTT